jgi:hypothetical protein
MILAASVEGGIEAIAKRLELGRQTPDQCYKVLRISKFRFYQLINT